MTKQPPFLDALGGTLIEKAESWDRRARRRRRVLGIAVVATAALAVAGLSTNFDGDPATVTADSPLNSDGSDSAPVDDLASEPVDGREPLDLDPTFVPPSFLAPRAGHSVTWTGSELVVWGGRIDEESSTAFADGAAFDPVTNNWRALAPAPIDGRSEHAAVWAGSEIIIVGGNGAGGASLDSNAAYDPAVDEWRVLPDLPVAVQAVTPVPMSTVWTGTYVVVWIRDQGRLFGIEPIDGSWVELPSVDVPGSFALGSLHWTGTELIVFGGEAPDPYVRGATLAEPFDGDWQPLPPVEFSTDGVASDPYPPNSFANGRSIVMWSRRGHEAPTVRLDLVDRAWSVVEPVPVPSCEGHQPPLETPSIVLVVDNCGDERIEGWIFDRTVEEWNQMSLDESQSAVNLGSAVWTGEEVLSLQTDCCFGAAGEFRWSASRLMLLPD